MAGKLELPERKNEVSERGWQSLPPSRVTAVPRDNVMYTQSCEGAGPIRAPHQMYRIREVTKITGLSRSTIYAYIATGNFPKPLRLGIRAVGWSSDAVFQWLAERDIAV